MLQQICDHIHNYFIREAWTGTFSISDETVSPTLPLKEGQRFAIKGSALNDGIYTWHDAIVLNDDDNGGAELLDETFTGTIYGLAIPHQLRALADEISAWVAKYGDAAASPYTSESFGGYSYTKASGSNGASSGGWQASFAPRLNRWRKVSGC